MRDLKGEILDLRFDGKLNPEISLLFNNISYDHRGQFNDLVSVVSLPYKNNLDWWVQGPSSRNTFASPFFHHFCCLHLLRELIKNGHFEFSKVIVDSKALKKIIENIINDSGVKQCKVQYNGGSFTKRIAKKLLSTPIFFTKKVIQHFIAGLTIRAKFSHIEDKQLVLIDTFIIPGYTANDRWYGVLWENLTEEMKAETFFVPTVVMTPLRSMFSTYKDLRSNMRNFLIKEDYLCLSDILFSFRHNNRIKKIKIRKTSVIGHDISELVYEELNNNRDIVTVIEALLIYRFIRRLSLNNIKARLAIDWFEGQAVDKAWNMAFRKYYPDIKRIGYRAFESFPFYLCSYPIRAERESGVIPDVMAVQGPGAISTVREFLPDLEVMVIPSFKSQHVWGCNPNNVSPNKFTVLIAFPISVHVSVKIIRKLTEAHELINLEKEITYIVKPHPTHLIDKIRKEMRGGILGSVLISEEKSFPNLLSRANLLITEASSSCLEALAVGVPVIIVGNEAGLTYDPIPKKIPEETYRKVRTAEQLADALRYYVNSTPDGLKKQKDFAKKIREDYFEPLTKDGINRFMDIKTKTEGT